MSDVRWIDPADCGCTDCVTGRAVPLNHATYLQLMHMLHGKLRSRLDSDTVVTLNMRFDLDSEDCDEGVTDVVYEALKLAKSVVIEVNDRTFQP